MISGLKRARINFGPVFLPEKIITYIKIVSYGLDYTNRSLIPQNVKMLVYTIFTKLITKYFLNIIHYFVHIVILSYKISIKEYFYHSITTTTVNLR